MSVFDKIKYIIGSNEWDEQSKDLAKEWQSLLKDSQDIQILLTNKGFQKILQQLRTDFKQRMQVVVDSDPELRSIRNMFIRTLGMAGADEQIEKMLDEFLDEPIALSTDK